jgi:hypothetical protein
MQQQPLQKHGMSVPMPEYCQHQQHGMFQLLACNNNCNEAVRHLHRHRQVKYIQMPPLASYSDACSHRYTCRCSVGTLLSFWDSPSHICNLKQQSQRDYWYAVGVQRACSPNALPNKKSSGDLSSHGSGSADAPLSEYALAAILVSCCTGRLQAILCMPYTSVLCSTNVTI